MIIFYQRFHLTLMNNKKQTDETDMIKTIIKHTK